MQATAQQEELEQSLREANAEIRRLKGVIDALLAAREADAEVKRHAVLKRQQEADEVETEAKATEEEVPGEKWKEFFLTNDVFREHIRPKLGETWAAILMEACGQMKSWPIHLKPTHVWMNHYDATSSIPLLKWCITRGYAMVGETVIAAAKRGILDVLKYVHENGCRWKPECCMAAAEGGHLDVLKYAHENGCPWDEDTCSSAAYGGHLHVLNYAHENGCPWNERTCSNVARVGHLDVLKYAHENGCSWNKKYCHISAKSKGYVDIVAWIASLEPSGNGIRVLMMYEFQ